MQNKEIDITSVEYIKSRLLTLFKDVTVYDYYNGTFTQYKDERGYSVVFYEHPFSGGISTIPHLNKIKFNLEILENDYISTTVFYKDISDSHYDYFIYSIQEFMKVHNDICEVDKNLYNGDIPVKFLRNQKLKEIL